MNKSTARIRSLIQLRQSEILIESPFSSERTSSYSSSLIELYPPSTKGLPQILVMAPSKSGVDRVVHAFDKHRAKSAVVLPAIGGTDYNIIASQLRQGCDYLVGTPGRLCLLNETNSLDTSNVSVVVLEQAEVLFSNPKVLDFVRQSVPTSCQRIFTAHIMSDWYDDMLKDLSRPGHTLDRVKLDITEKRGELACLRHEYLKTTATDEMRYLKLLIESRKAKSIIFCNRTADVFSIASDSGLEGDVIPLTPDMSDKMKIHQVGKFKSRRRGVIVTTDLSTNMVQDVCIDLIVNMGIPQDVALYFGRGSHGLENGRMITLFRTKESDHFSKLRSKTGLSFTPVKSEEVNHAKLSTSFVQSLLQTSSTLSIPCWLLTEGSDLSKLHDVNTIACLVQFAESRSHLFEKRSALSGTVGFVPILLVDPFMKKVRNSEMAEKLVRGCILDKSLIQLGRIALSAKGYIVDVPSDCVGDVVDSRRLRLKNIRAVSVTQIPPLIQSERLFSLKQSRRDKRQATRLLQKKRS